MSREAGTRSPERETTHAPRLKAERLVDIGPGLPQEIKNRTVALAKTLEPYEDFASEFGHGNISDKLALVEILDQENVISPKFINEFYATGRLLSGVVAAMQEKFDLAPREQRLTLKKRLEEQSAEHNRATTKIAQKLGNDRRPLAQHIFAEELHASMVFSLERKIRAHGFYETWRREKDTNDHLHWMAFADAVKRLPRVELQRDAADFTVEEKFRLLKDAEFMPSEQFYTELPYQAGNEPLKVIMQVSEKTNALTLVNFAVTMPGMRLRGSLSRATGQLHMGNAILLSLEEHFRIPGAQSVYVTLREIIIHALYDAWETGKLKEQEYVSLDNDTDNAIEAETPAITADESAEAPTPSPAVQSASESPPAIPGRENKTRYSTRRFTWRRVMAALKRCGVEIDMSHAHPKLRFEGRTAGYLNSHDKDTRHNRQVLRDTLNILEIPFETFIKNLH